MTFIVGADGDVGRHLDVHSALELGLRRHAPDGRAEALVRVLGERTGAALQEVHVGQVFVNGLEHSEDVGGESIFMLVLL